jgi:ABC-type polysaccharide/polyol phosphate export permease
VGQTLRELWRYRDLVALLVQKELKLRYRRSVLGFAWTMLNPLFTMVILSVVFSHILRVHVEKFPVFVLSALLPWNFFVQSLVGGALSIIHNESLLRNVRLPRAIFPVALTASHLVNLVLALVPLLIVMVWQGVPLRPSVVALPWALLVLWLFTTGLALAFAAWTVFFRDLSQIVEVSLTALFYLTPVVFPLSVLPEQWERLFRLNPMVYMVLPMRTIFFDGSFPRGVDALVATALAVLSFLLGLAIFRRRENLFLVYLS